MKLWMEWDTGCADPEVTTVGFPLQQIGWSIPHFQTQLPHFPLDFPPFSGKNLRGSREALWQHTWNHVETMVSRELSVIFLEIQWDSKPRSLIFVQCFNSPLPPWAIWAPKRGSSAKPVGLLADRSKDCTDQSHVRFHFDNRNEQSKLPWFYVVLLLQQIGRWINPWVSATWVVLTGCLLHEIDCYNQQPCLLECPGRWIDTRPAYLRLTQLQCICKFVSQC